jgi:hypothetical protein
MQPFGFKSGSESPKASVADGLIQPEWLVGVATVPVLAGLLTGRAIIGWMVQLGVASEEFFRGERLPVLKVPLDPSEPDV